MSTTFCDPGVGDRTAKPGTEQWAKYWRMNIQSAVKDTTFDVANFTSIVDIGIKHRAWTLLQRKDGKPFKNWDDFIAHEYPWGLSDNPERIRKLLESSKGKRAAQLETVSEPETGNQHTAAPNDWDEREEVSKNTTSNLRAINRAPEIVADLYRDGLINQVDAARLGKKDSDKSEIAAEIARVVQETIDLELKDRRKAINEAARKIAGAEKPTHAEICVKAFRKTENRLEVLKVIVGTLEPCEAAIVRDWVLEKLQ